MWTSLTITLLAFLLLPTTNAQFDRFHRKQSSNRGGRRPNRFNNGPNRTKIVTVTVRPMPIGTYDGIIYPGTSNALPTPSSIASGIFPPGASAFPTGTDVIPTIFPTVTDVASGIFPPGNGATGSGTGTGGVFPTGVFLTGSGGIAPTGGFPIFTSSPVVSVPPSTETIIAPTAAPESEAPITSAIQGGGSLTYPVFTSSAVVSIPSGTEEVPTVLPSSTAISNSTSALPTAPVTTSVVSPSSVVTASGTFPVFTGAPSITIPSGTEAPVETAAPTSLAAVPSSATRVNSALTYPIFTGTPVIQVPTAAAVPVGQSSGDIYGRKRRAIPLRA